MNLTKSLKYSFSDCDTSYKNKKQSKSIVIECNCCTPDLESTLNASLDSLSDVQLEIKKTLRELFLLNHRRNRQRILSKQL